MKWFAAVAGGGGDAVELRHQRAHLVEAAFEGVLDILDAPRVEVVDVGDVGLGQGGRRSGEAFGLGEGVHGGILLDESVSKRDVILRASPEESAFVLTQQQILRFAQIDSPPVGRSRRGAARLLTG